MNSIKPASQSHHVQMRQNELQGRIYDRHETDDEDDSVSEGITEVNKITRAGSDNQVKNNSLTITNAPGKWSFIAE